MSAMKIYISADIEGDVSFEQGRPGNAEYERATGG